MTAKVVDFSKADHPPKSSLLVKCPCCKRNFYDEYVVTEIPLGVFFRNRPELERALPALFQVRIINRGPGRDMRKAAGWFIADRAALPLVKRRDAKVHLQFPDQDGEA